MSNPPLGPEGIEVQHARVYYDPASRRVVHMHTIVAASASASTRSEWPQRSPRSRSCYPNFTPHISTIWTSPNRNCARRAEPVAS